MANLLALRELVEHDVFVQERLQQNALRRYEVPIVKSGWGMIQLCSLEEFVLNMEVVEYCSKKTSQFYQARKGVNSCCR